MVRPENPLKKRRGIIRVRTLWIVMTIQLLGIIASIVGVLYNRSPRICDANFNDGLFTPQKEPRKWSRSRVLEIKRDGFTHIPNELLPFPPDLGGTLGMTYKNNIHYLFSKLLMPWSQKVADDIVKTQLELKAQQFERIYNLVDYERIYKNIGTPVGSNSNALTDAYFGRSKVTWSPEYLTLLPSLNQFPMNITDADVVDTLRGTTLANLVQQKRLFYVDHAEVTLSLLRFQRRGVYVCAPKALYYLNDDGNLMPLAIQLNPNEVIFTPRDGWDWLLAKIIYNSMESARVSFVDHFLDSHIALIPFSTSMNRMLSPQHPVFVMLDAILAKNLGVVTVGYTVGLAPTYGSFVVHAGLDANGTFTGISNRYRNWTFYDQDPIYSLYSRGLDAIANHPYRTYISRLYQASQDLFTQLVDVYYPSDGSVLSDSELQAFAGDLTGEGRVKGFPTLIRTRAELSRALGHLHFLCTTLHAVTNGISLEYRGALPSVPLTIHRSIPRVKGTVNERNIVEWLPALEQALSQARLIKVFGRPLEDNEHLL
ncbi:hypothetical protein HDV05_000202, partial [Chytridiales sp. JEL 0842]